MVRSPSVKAEMVVMVHTSGAAIPSRTMIPAQYSPDHWVQASSEFPDSRVSSRYAGIARGSTAARRAIGLDHAGRSSPRCRPVARAATPGVRGAGQHGHAEAAGLGHGEGRDGAAEHVGLQLRQRRLFGAAADGEELVDPQSGRSRISTFSRISMATPSSSARSTWPRVVRQRRPTNGAGVVASK